MNTDKARPGSKSAEDASLRKLRWRFALINAVSILAVLALVVVAIYGTTRSRLESQSQKYLRMRAEQAIRDLDDPNPPQGESNLPGETQAEGSNTGEDGGERRDRAFFQPWQQDIFPAPNGENASAQHQSGNPPRIHEGFFALQDIFQVAEPNKQRLGTAVLLLDQDGQELQVLAGEPPYEENQSLRSQLA